MIYILLNFILLVFIGGFFWWALSQPILNVMDHMTTLFPGAIPGSEIAFIDAIVNWMPLFLLIGGLVWVITSAIRRSPEGYYR